MIDLLSTLPEEWTTWGILIIFGLPMAIILAGELLLYLEKRESKFIPVVYNVRNILLPNLTINLIFSKIMKLGDDSLLLMISDTFFWLVLILSTLKFVNILIYSDVLPQEVQARIPKLLVDFSRTFLVLLGASIIASNVWGADLGRLLSALGVGSVVLGLALQDVLGGLFSGIALLSSKPFVVGDWIKVNDMVGKVTNIDWRSVTLVDFADDAIVVPNSVIAKDRFRNFSRPTPIHRETVGFDIAFDTPPNKVKQVLLEAAHETKEILSEPAPSVVLTSYDEFSIHYDIRFFVNDYGRVPAIRNDFTSRIWYANRRYGIKFPTRTQQIYNFDGSESAILAESTKLIQSKLKESMVFSVPDEQLSSLSEHCTIEDFGVGESLIQRGVETQRVYLVLEGIAKEYIESKKGEIIHDGRFKKGDIFGLASLVRKEPSLVTVSALSDIKVISIEIEAMKELLQKNPDVAQSLENIADAHEKRVEKSLFLS